MKRLKAKQRRKARSSSGRYQQNNATPSEFDEMNQVPPEDL